MTARIGLIWAEARDGVIGAAGTLPWHVPEDLAHFKRITDGHPVVMGRRTWDSLPERFRPLPGRRNIVVTRNDAWSADGGERADSLDAALALAEADGPDEVWVIGGGELFRQSAEGADRLEVTELDLAVEGDTFAPGRVGWQVALCDPPEGWHTSRTGIPYRFVTLVPAS